MKKIALFSTNFLAFSETFIFEELRHHTRYQAEVFCWRRLCADRFPFEPVHVANPAYIVTGKSPKFNKVLRKGNFDIAHAHFGTGAAYALPFAKKHNLPFVVTFHGYDVPMLRNWMRFHPYYWRYAAKMKSLFEQMDLGLCASQELLEMLLETGVDENKLRHFPLGIDLDFWKPKSSKEKDPKIFRAVMVGRFTEKKGFEYGIRAFAKASQSIEKPMELILIGAGEREEKLMHLAQNLGIASQMKIKQNLPPVQVQKEIIEADVLLAPSVVDAHGNRESGLIVVKEAAACEVPAIGTYHGGIHEIIDDEKTGFLVPERNVHTLANRLQRLVEDPERRIEMGKQARAKMKQEYDIKKRVNELENLYDQVIQSALSSVK